MKILITSFLIITGIILIKTGRSRTNSRIPGNQELIGLFILAAGILISVIFLITYFANIKL